MKNYDESVYYVGAIVDTRKIPYGETFVFDYNSLESRGVYTTIGIASFLGGVSLNENNI